VAKQTILLVEDERDIAFILGQTFRAEGFAFVVAETAEDGLKLARKHKPALIISDIMLPRMDGLSMVKELRRESQIPVLFLTARKDESDRIRGFQVGADDYLAKPFSMRELVCRVRAVLRRKASRAAPASEEGVKLGSLELDFARREARVNGKYRHLAPREFQLLRMLVEADGKVLTREHLLKEIWGYDESIGVSTRTVDQHIARLRRKLLAERKRLVTVKNVGYRLKPA
jgi:DNA-binding response OmpR family regulator